MKFYMFGLWKKGMRNDEPFETFIGLSARNGDEAYAKLEDLVGCRGKQFILYDVVEDGEQ